MSQIDVSDGDLIVFIGGIIVGISSGLLTNVWVTSKEIKAQLSGTLLTNYERLE
ncbi:hypothetical protein [Methanosarcina sp.]|uniref:hypothetical protein n=1 Tax=Methanosarcina sp. TaxID=2213 RepID=UPI002AB9A101|nr:hypothetical protein [Methanosarcina sp.]MDY9925282.1 hypothetical protein [Methanosarcina sp.]